MFNTYQEVKDHIEEQGCECKPDGGFWFRVVTVNGTFYFTKFLTRKIDIKTSQNIEVWLKLLGLMAVAICVLNPRLFVVLLYKLTGVVL